MGSLFEQPDVLIATALVTLLAVVTLWLISVIRGELPERLRLSCIHEELAQSLGLVADYPRARLSIFNDNEEFAVLTRRDELMLKMLYDPSLKSGMTATQAQPMISRIARRF